MQMLALMGRVLVRKRRRRLRSNHDLMCKLRFLLDRSFVLLLLVRQASLVCRLPQTCKAPLALLFAETLEQTAKRLSLKTEMRGDMKLT